MDLVVKNEKGEYLDYHDVWGPADKAYLYGNTSTVAFTHAEELGGKVFLRTKAREIEMTLEDVYP